MFREALLSEIYGKKMMLIKVVLGIFLFVVMIGFIMHEIEPNVFPDVFSGIWWTVVTISTVGYGDYVPESLLGRVLGMLLILTGIAIFSFFVTNLAASTLVIKEQREKGLGSFKNSGHLLVIGWNERSRMLIRETHRLYPYKEIVLIDETLPKLPHEYKSVRFIKGSPREDEALVRGNIKDAETVVITANLHVEERLADANTILTLISMKGLNPNLYCIAEIITQDQLKNAKRAGADEVIEASFHVSLLLMNASLYHGLTDVIAQMLDHSQKDHLCIHSLPDTLVGKTFADATEKENSREKFLLGVRRRTETILHPADDFFLKEDDELIYVKR
ncbi:ion transporter [Salipaludibacillus keqinensis]|uniref:Ion transporter n=1 Tax=Salipaludibacillus keqinensis TaxID=2045207 RepID=A0A323TGD9_9BACI|nr:ion channel [Salipaludibacillus keqinensis]PYZ93888.1 ion transporter [Salipaludibacillus keqinensis]